MYSLAIYINSGITDWGRALDERDIVIAKHEFRWLWLARICARNIIQNLNSGRCGYSISINDAIVEMHSQREQ